MQVFNQVKSVLFKLVVIGFASFFVGCAGKGLTNDLSTPEGALNEMITVIENADLVEFMRMVAMGSDEMKGISDEQLKMAFKMIEPELKLMLEEGSKEFKSKKGVAEVRIDSRKQLSEDTVELVVTLVMGNGEVVDPQNFIMKKRYGRYFYVID